MKVDESGPSVTKMTRGTEVLQALGKLPMDTQLYIAELISGKISPPQVPPPKTAEVQEQHQPPPPQVQYVPEQGEMRRDPTFEKWDGKP